MYPTMNGHRNGVIHHGTTFTYDDVQNTAQFLKERTNVQPEVGVVCGSGLGGLADNLTDSQAFHYKDVPNFPLSTVPGHAGRLVFGMLGGKPVICMQGRFHAYEGYSMAKLTFPIRVFHALGVHTVIVTNASGGLNPNYQVGDVMVMKDHINLPGLAGQSPLVGVHEQRFGPRFVPLSDAYDKNLMKTVHEVSKELDMDFVREGVYVVQVGPCFETVAECRMLRMMGADVTGMSSVPEVIVARQLGMRCVGLSLVTNMCITDYDTDDKANHEEVLETGRMRAKDLEKLVSTVVHRIQDVKLIPTSL